ncbi:hypothetical protein RFM68_25055 [Mesorhizobium sp. MSK_1335]|uniref:Uncharacterized protein n=1 Tax=Mesorhizobium montanum TaxID=3072323 RepID=A0ABU4ZV13_9HYPH|nr:hypothetical protein [Mesorhizobium sp. MSK_1335]MDX8527771.1 hypothetical protein [Mesorhizobium sp. MSK_1335]
MMKQSALPAGMAGFLYNEDSRQLAVQNIAPVVGNLRGFSESAAVALHLVAGDGGIPI